jgi:hypothetical protein
MVYLAAFIPVQGGFDYLLFLQHCDQGTSSHAVHYLLAELHEQRHYLRVRSN